MKASNSPRRHSIRVRAALLCAMIYLIVANTNLQIELSRKQAELNDIYSSKTTVELKNQELENLIENGTESDYIERAARDRLGYVYANEEVFTDISGK